MRFENKKILVVGGAGFVGSNLCHKLLTHNPKHLYIVDNLLSADITNVPTEENVTFYPVSINDEKVLKSIPKDIDYVFHLATYHGNQSSMIDPIADHENNTFTTLKLCEHFNDSTSLKKFVYSSAGCTVAKKTFDKTNATSETAPVSLYLDSPYQISKIIGEFYGNYYFTRHDLPFVKARFQNVYGPREILGAGRWRGSPATVWRNVTPTFIWKALKQESLPIENGGIATRDFIFVDDIVEGLIACAISGKSGDVYNLASGEETSIKELAELINELTENPTPIDLAPPRNWDRSGRRYGETSKSESQLGFKAKVNLHDGLSRTIAWTHKYCQQIERCIAQHDCFMGQYKSLSSNDKQADKSLAS